MNALGVLAQVVLWVAIGMFTLVGLSGVLLGPWEFYGVIPVPLAQLGADAPPLLNQLRFLKALELAVGLFLWAVRKDVFVVRSVNRAVLVTLTVTPMARLISCLVDGSPGSALLALMCVELTGAAVVIAYSASCFAKPARVGRDVTA